MEDPYREGSIGQRSEQTVMTKDRFFGRRRGCRQTLVTAPPIVRE